MKFVQVSGYHAYDDSGELIATLHIDSMGNFILDNGDESLTFASNAEEADIVYSLLGKVINENKGVAKPTNILTMTEEEKIKN